MHLICTTKARVVFQNRRRCVQTYLCTPGISWDWGAPAPFRPRPVSSSFSPVPSLSLSALASSLIIASSFLLLQSAPLFDYLNLRLVAPPPQKPTNPPRTFLSSIYPSASFRSLFLASVSITSRFLLSIDRCSRSFARTQSELARVPVQPRVDPPLPGHQSFMSPQSSPQAREGHRKSQTTHAIVFR